MRNAKVDVKKLVFVPVPLGLRMKYRHYYTQEAAVTVTKLGGTVEVEQPKKLIGTTAILENAESGERVCSAQALVNPKDTPIKKLGRCIAHNRCINHYHASFNSSDHSADAAGPAAGPSELLSLSSVNSVGDAASGSAVV